MIILYLTCASPKEADEIGKALLDNKLVACVRQTAVDSSFWWENKIEHDHEMLLMMESIEEKFDAIEAKVTELHSYDQFVLTSVKVDRTTPGVKSWLKQTLG
jgi:periplasmic divalent cation tolerance protein